jgi:putative transposase
VIKHIKTYTTTRYIQGANEKNWQAFYKHLWQRGYYENIIRNNNTLDKIRQYILDNPIKWKTDKENVSIP